MASYSEFAITARPRWTSANTDYPAHFPPANES